MGVPTQFSPKNKCVSNDSEWLKKDFKHNFKKYHFNQQDPPRCKICFIFVSLNADKKNIFFYLYGFVRAWLLKVFWLCEELRVSLCLYVCLSVCPAQVCLKHWIFIFFLIGMSQICLRSVSGQSQVSLRSVAGQSQSAYWGPVQVVPMVTMTDLRLIWD